MKKVLLTLLCAATVCVAVFMLAGCVGRLPSFESDDSENPADSETVLPDLNDPADGKPVFPDAGRNKIRFVIDGETVSVQTYISPDDKIIAPELPVKKGYAASWEKYDLTGGEITVNAIYSPINYTVTYLVDGSSSQVLDCTIENFTEVEPTIPEKYGYDGKWVYGLDKTNGNIVATVEYTLKPFEVNFYVDGKLIHTEIGDVEHCDICPPIPEKEHFTAEWEKIVYDGNPVEVNAVYKPVEYTVTFSAEGGQIASLPYTVLDESIDEPAVPEKPYYSGSWENYSLTGGNLTVNAVYTPVTYTVSFYADGNMVSSAEYTVESDGVTVPEVPYKSGYDGVWQSFELTGGDIRVNAIYTPVKGTADLSYERCGDGWTVGVYKGSQTRIIIPSVYEGLPVIAISERAFANCGVESVSICEGVLTIGRSAFYNCSALKEITFPESLEEIGANAFSECGALEKLRLPDGIKVISFEAFMHCGFTELKLPENLVTIEESAFYKCIKLERVIIPAAVEFIGSKAFAGCINLEEVIYEGKMPETGDFVFAGCTKYTGVS